MSPHLIRLFETKALRNCILKPVRWLKSIPAPNATPTTCGAALREILSSALAYGHLPEASNAYG
jgi:hypothetical protein